MYSYKFGGKDGSTFDLDIADDLVVVRTKKNKTLSDAIKSKSAKNTLAQLAPIAQFPEAGVSVLQCRQAKDRLLRLRDQARQLFKKEKDVQFAGRVLQDVNTGVPVVYTENFFVKFKDHLSNAKSRAILNKYDLQVKRKLNYAKNAFFVAAHDGTGLKIFDIAQNLLDTLGRQVTLPLQGFVQIGGIAGMMLVMMDAHGSSINVRLQCIFGVG